MSVLREIRLWRTQAESRISKVKSQTRCNIRKDAGLTRANTTGIKYICLFFARGCCPYGWECEYLHTLPDPVNAMPDSSKDVFARDKFSDYRDDMGGVGSFNRQNRTLYVGRIKETGNGQETEEVVLRHFKEWGDIERGTWPLSYLYVNKSLNFCSSGASVPQCGFRDLRPRSKCTIWQRSNGLPIHGQRRNPQR